MVMLDEFFKEEGINIIGQSGTGKSLRLSLGENIINGAEAAKILGITRQAISKLVKNEKLIPIKVYPNGNIFWKPDIEHYKTLKEKGK